MAGSGSSPLARGTRDDLKPGEAATRLIPARAGNTRQRCAVRYGSSAHPRSRGEHREDVLEVFHLHGSSPLARGTRTYRFLLADRLRLIPARAGNTRGA